MNLREFLSPSFWFSMRPGPITSALVRAVMIIVVALFFVFAIVSFIARSLKSSSPTLKRLFTKGIHFGFTFGILGALLLFFALQEIPILSSRSLWALLTLGALIWGIAIFIFFLKVPREITRERQKKEEFEKYLPK